MSRARGGAWVGMSRATPVWALALDLLLGEPVRAHPVRGMGRLLDGALRRRRARSPWAALLEGAAAALGGTTVTATVAWLLSRPLRRVPAPGRAVAEGLLLKPALSVRELVASGRRVRRALEAGDLPRARASVGRDLVSRPTGDLSAGETASAAVESLAENLADGVVAPLLWATVLGLPGAYAYRFLNTADAVVGYRTPEFEAYGRFAARADDLANLLPARLAAGLIALAAPVAGGRTGRALRIAVRDSGRTESPNAGWPMAAMAGALDVRLAKRDHYALNAGAPWPGPRDLARAERVVCGAAGLAFLAAVAAAREESR